MRLNPRRTTSGRLHTLAAPACAVLLGLTLAACGSDDSGDEGDGGDTESTSQETGGDGDFLTGTEDDWMAVACDGNAFNETDATANEARGQGAVRGLACDVQFDQGTDADGDAVYSYVEAYYYDSDQTDRLTEWVENAQADDTSFANLAWGQVSEDEWVMVWEDASTAELTDPHLEVLTEYGFTVVVNDEEL